MSYVLKAGMDPLLLGLLDQQPDHGYALVSRLRGEYGIDASDGTVYPCLFRLEKSGAIEATWDTSTGRRRKVFHLTPMGRRQLRKTKTQWLAFSSALRRVLNLPPATENA